MLKGKILLDFARLIIKIGVNLQPGQGLEIICPIERVDVAHALAKVGYDCGAKIVNVRWEDEELDRINFSKAKTEDLSFVPKWKIDSRRYLVDNNFCYVAIASENPLAFKDIPAQKLGEIFTARSKAYKKFSDAVMNNQIRWCVASVPTKQWAKQVFPNSKSPEKDLSRAIEKTMRLDSINPVKAWEEHVENLEKRAKFLNEQDFSSLRFKNKLGTDLTVGLADGHAWLSAREKSKDGVYFMANMPTEEVFTAPHRLKTEGVLKSAMPLCYNGNVIDNFSIAFKKGKIVNFSAEKGEDVLRSLIETDNGTKYLGEVALIGKNSPISMLKTLFFNTLFDENASCHLAIGKAYPTCVKDGDKLNKSKLKGLGLNDSVEHVDFMIGTDDLEVTGIKKDGKEIAIFKDGDWVI